MTALQAEGEAVRLEATGQVAFAGNGQSDLTYSVELPLTKKTDRITDAILALGDSDQLKVKWSDRKGGKDKG